MIHLPLTILQLGDNGAFCEKNYTRAIQNRFLKKVSNISQIPYMLSLESVLWVAQKILVAISLIFIDIFDFSNPPPHFPLERLKGFGGVRGLTPVWDC